MFNVVFRKLLEGPLSGLDGVGGVLSATPARHASHETSMIQM